MPRILAETQTYDTISELKFEARSSKLEEFLSLKFLKVGYS